MDPSSLGPVIRAPSALYKLFRFNKWRKARRRAIQLFVCEAIQASLFPHAHESSEAQYTAAALWQVLQRTPVPGELRPSGLAQRSASALDTLMFGKFPRFGISAVGLKSRLSLWMARALLSEEGREILDAVEFERPDNPSHRNLDEDARSVGALVAEMFVRRLEVGRFGDAEIESVRIWLREEIRKNDSTALNVHQRFDTDVTRTVEASSALAAFTGVSYLLDQIGFYGVYAALGGGGVAILSYFGSRLALRRRPLPPRQVGFRLYVLEVICDFLSVSFGIPIERTVRHAQSVLDHARVYSNSEIMHTEGKRLELPAVRRPASSGSSHEIVGVLVGGPDDVGESNRIHEFRLAISRLNDLSGTVGDSYVQANLMELEGAANSATSVEELYPAINRVLDSLSR